MNQEGTPATSHSAATRRSIGAILLLILITTALRAPLLAIPLDRDEGEYAYIGWRLGHHELPYREWVDQKPPGIFWIYQLALALPLKPIAAIHLMAALYSAATACAFYFLARRFMNGFWAVTGGVLFSILSAHPLIQGTAANTEVFMLLPLILSVLAFLEAEPGGRARVRLSILAGAFTGIAIAFKQVAAVNWPFLVILYPLVFGGVRRLRNMMSFALCSGAGIALVWTFISAYFAVRGGFHEMLYNVLTHNLEYVQALPWQKRLTYLRSTLAWLSPSHGIALAFAIVGAMALWKSGGIKPLFWLLCWLASSFIGVSASGQYFPHYFQQLLPPLCILAALGAEALAQIGIGGQPAAEISRSLPGSAGIPAGELERPQAAGKDAGAPRSAVPIWARNGLICAVLLALPIATIAPYLFKYTPEEAVQRIYPGDIFAQTPLLADHIAKATTSDQHVFVFGTEPEILFYARRASATRYIFLYPLYGPYRDALQKQQAAASEIESNQPAAVAFVPNAMLLAPGTEQFFTEWTYAELRDRFQREGYVTRDRAGVGHYHTWAADQPIPDPPELVGAIYVRKSATP